MRLPYKSGTVRVTSIFGIVRRDLGQTDPHKGIDLVGTDKTIVAVAPGKIGFAGQAEKKPNDYTWQWGNYVRVDGDDGRSYYYCHMSSISVRWGQRVKAGDTLGIEGSTGYSTASHLHFEVRQGYKNSVDPTPYIGIANKAGATKSVEKCEDYATKVCEKCGLEAQTRAYLDKYKYAADLWRKLWEAMQ